MKNKFFIFLFSIFFHSNILAESISIQAKKISLDKDKATSIFEDEVVVKTEYGVIKSDFAEYNKKKGFLVFKENVKAEDIKKNVVETEYAEYSEINKIFKTEGLTRIITSEGYIVESQNVIFNNKNKSITSENKTLIKDNDDNKIFLNNFSYETNNNIFKSLGSVKIEDKLKNVYNFAQIYIDTKKKEILGTDIKAFLNQEEFKIHKNNKPRVFANTISLNEQISSFNKSIFTLCDYRKNDKCPPWTIQASKMLHDNKKKTIYYDNAMIKIYDIPIFYIPRLSHPDPSVKRRSGFMPPSVNDSKNLGAGVSIPYFFAINDDKNFTLTNRFYATENPLFIGEYHQAFKRSNFLADFGFTEGYKNTSVTKKSGQKTHFFSKFVKNFKGKNNSNNSFNLSVQKVSDDKYLKLYKIKSNLVDFNNDTLESSIDFKHEDENIFFGLQASVYETLKESYNDKYEYILPEITVDKNLFSDDKNGNLDLQTNFKVHNYDTNRLTSFFINDFNWNSKEIFSDLGIKNQLLANVKNINYESKNVDPYKNDFTSELFGAIGLMTELNLEKDLGLYKHFLTPKIFLRYSPGSMRQEDAGSRLKAINAFDINRLDNINNFETGLSAAFGFDYQIDKSNKSLDFSVAQILNEKENKKMSDKSSMNEKLSDLVGSANFELNSKFNLNYNFAIDQNYSDFNYNEIGTSINLGSMNLDFNYLQENKHIGNQDYFKTKIGLKNKDNGLFAFETKRNLITNSAEFYNLSYEYVNDCLRAGLVYRREFYNDSEIEPENSLMFKITLTPFGDINSPTFSK